MTYGKYVKFYFKFKFLEPSVTLFIWYVYLKILWYLKKYLFLDT